MNNTLDTIPIAIPIYKTETSPLLDKRIKCDKCGVSLTYPNHIFIPTNKLFLKKKYYYCQKCRINNCRTCHHPYCLTSNISPYEAGFYRCENCLLSNPKSIINSCSIS